MNQRNTIQVSEANALRYIPSTVIEPFGYTGMPILKDMMNETKYNIINPINGYRELVHSMGGGFATKSIINAVELIARNRGGIDPECTHVVDTEDSRVFQVAFGIKNYPRRILFGFNIYHS
jgi:hypothetical protein